MKIINGIDNIPKPFKNAVITIGNFDGVHLGHQALLNKTVQKAKEFNGTAIAMTFEPHPNKILIPNKKLPLITVFKQKISLIKKAGIDILICIPFSKKFANIDPKIFIEKILINKIGIKAIIAGDDYNFGKNRKGNIELLRKYTKQFNYEVITLDMVDIPNATKGRISSTKIRELVLNGKLEDAKNLLGRFYQIKGEVVKGRNRGGKLLGFPTANINLYDELCPKIGVYAVIIKFCNKLYKGVANIGYSPTFDDHQLTIEVHILDFNKDIYKEKIKINFIKRLRDEKKFSSIDELSEQIKNDIKTGLEILKGIRC